MGKLKFKPVFVVGFRAYHPDGNAYFLTATVGAENIGEAQEKIFNLPPLAGCALVIERVEFSGQFQNESGQNFWVN